MTQTIHGAPFVRIEAKATSVLHQALADALGNLPDGYHSEKFTDPAEQEY